MKKQKPKLKISKKPFHYSLGKRGEQLAREFLSGKGYRVLENNYRCKLGEIDIIAEKGGRIYFAEVKTRRSERYGQPIEAVTTWKQKKLSQLAAWYCKVRQIQDAKIAFLIISILFKNNHFEIQLTEDVFY